MYESARPASSSIATAADTAAHSRLNVFSPTAIIVVCTSASFGLKWSLYSSAFSESGLKPCLPVRSGSDDPASSAGQLTVGAQSTTANRSPALAWRVVTMAAKRIPADLSNSWSAVSACLHTRSKRCTCSEPCSYSTNSVGLTGHFLTSGSDGSTKRAEYDRSASSISSSPKPVYSLTNLTVAVAKRTLSRSW
jgi:hypothetical protein